MDNQFDVFLSHNSKDKPEVRELATRLRKLGIRVWLDEEQLLPGQIWQTELQNVIKQIPAAVVAWGRSGIGPWEDVEMRVCLSEFVSRQVRVIPVMLPGAPSQPELPIFLRECTWADFRKEPDDNNYVIKKLADSIFEANPDNALRKPRSPSHAPASKSGGVLLVYCRNNPDGKTITEHIHNSLEELFESPLKIVVWSESKLGKERNEENEQKEHPLEKNLKQCAIAVCVMPGLEEFKNSPSLQLLHHYWKEKGLRLFAFRGSNENDLGHIFTEEPQHSKTTVELTLKQVPIFPRRTESDRKFTLAGAVWDLAHEIKAIVEDPYYEPSSFPPLPVAHKELYGVNPDYNLVLCGREEELKRLDDAWYQDNVRIVMIVGSGGSGKTALVKHWLAKLERENFRGADPVFGWSFYSQAMSEIRSSGKDKLLSTDPFFRKAFPVCAGREGLTGQERKALSPIAKGPLQKGKQLAELLGCKALTKEPRQPIGRRNEHDCLGADGLPIPKRSGLLILDGLEPLIFPSEETNGGCKSVHDEHRGAQIADIGLQAFLNGMLAPNNHGLCVITTREAFDFPKDCPQLLKIDLEMKISIEAAADLLRLGGIQGGDQELKDFAENLGRYPHALTLAAAFLRKMRKERVVQLADCTSLCDKLKKIIQDKIKEEKKRDFDVFAKAIVGAFDDIYLTDQQRQVLQLLTLFKGPADQEAVKALRKKGIPHLSDKIATDRCDDEAWIKLVDDLVDCRLLNECVINERDLPKGTRAESRKKTAGRSDNGAYFTIKRLDTHAVIREFYEEKMKNGDEELKDAWKNGHCELFEFFKKRGMPKTNGKESVKQPSIPDKAQSTYADHGNTHDAEIQPVVKPNEHQIRDLFVAVTHGCLAGKYEDAWKLFWENIRQKYSNYSGNELGLWSSDQSVLSYFFDKRWDKPNDALQFIHAASAMNEAAYDLRAMGHPKAAIKPLDQCLKILSKQDDLELTEEARRLRVQIAASGNLFKCYLAMGEIEQAVEKAKQAVKYAEKLRVLTEEELHWKPASLTWLGEALRYKGDFGESEKAFQSAETIENEQSSDHLSETNNFRYCEFLLDQAERRPQYSTTSKQDATESVSHSKVTHEHWNETDFEPVLLIRKVRERTYRLLNGLDDKSKSKHVRRPGLANILYHLTLGRAWLLDAQYLKSVGGKPRTELSKARQYISKAVRYLREEGNQTYLLHGLLLEAAYLRISASPGRPNENFVTAEERLEEVIEIAALGRMRLFEIEYHLELARLKREQYRYTNSTKHLEKAILSLDDAEALASEAKLDRHKVEIKDFKFWIKEQSREV